jgi:thioredoxin-related protein
MDARVSHEACSPRGIGRTETSRRPPFAKAGLLSFLLVVGIAVPGQAQEEHPKSKIKWLHDFPAAQEQAKKEGKLLLLHFGAEWCSWCRKMDADAFADKSVGQTTAKFYVSVELDVDREKDLVKKYRVERVPTAVVLLPEGDVVDMLDGYAPSAEFKGWLGSWADAFARHQKAEEESRRKPDDREATCRKVESLLRLNQTERAARTAESAIALLSKSGTPSPEERQTKAELLVHLGDAYLDLGESPRKILELAKGIEELDAGGGLGFEVHAMFLRAAVDEILAHELEEEAQDLDRQKKKGPSERKKADARKLQTSVLRRLEECLEKYPQSDRADAILMWTGHLSLEVKNDPASARKIFQRVTEQFPNSPHADEARKRIKDLSGEQPKSERKDKKP